MSPRLSFAIVYILYFYLAGAGVMPNLTVTAVVPLYAHPLYYLLTIVITTTLPYSY
ncbi:hypothetical protein K432DRAFT_412252 [Lepidopterella palustris CBS 459.81]|uniref:Uncharacterized protein n=1 Tax=Lepidopterella palustris CBS 459.81 TaxID=1314670 RepID=A0A8E2J7P6_9PEZI|nr:hypothetical protein K432DRAFT_412252 [Lepidopterella palustris CBS 459.81]